MDPKGLIFILLLCGLTVYISGQDLCLPDCSVSSPTRKVPDPLDCTQFYYCSEDGMPSEIPYPCPDGTSFNDRSMDCTGASDCFPICGYCHLTCTGEGDVVADPFDCSVYYECGIAGPKPASVCPGHIPNFDSVNQKCVDDERKCCRPTCEPFCETVRLKVPDPKDCTKYYECTVNPPYPLFPCPNGENFDIGNGVCSPTAKCTILCPDTTTTDSGDITTTTDSGDITTSTDSGDITTTTDSGDITTTTDSGDITTTTDSGDITTTTDSGDITTTTDSGDITTTTDSGDITTTTDSGDITTTTDSGDITTTTDSGDITTTTDTTPDTTTPDTSGNCFPSFMCETRGLFPKCTYCDPGYFYCPSGGQLGIEDRCTEPKLFNPVPESPFCVYPDECPYYPFE